MKDFIRKAEKPKILIVREKLLTGFDAPILYCMYLDNRYPRGPQIDSTSALLWPTSPVVVRWQCAAPPPCPRTRVVHYRVRLSAPSLLLQ